MTNTPQRQVEQEIWERVDRILCANFGFPNGKAGTEVKKRGEAPNVAFFADAAEEITNLITTLLKDAKAQGARELVSRAKKRSNLNHTGNQPAYQPCGKCLMEELEALTRMEDTDE